MSARRRWAWPLVPLYAVVLALKNGLRAIGILRVKSLEWPVISVGSLSAGGAGKTPVVIALAKLLKARGWDVDVLSRGYRREGVGAERVGGARGKQVLRSAQDDNFNRDDDFKRGDDFEDWSRAAKRFGDEPVLIAQEANVPVWVGANRFEAGTRAEEAAACVREADPPPAAKDGNKRVHLLDDGFQHRKLARAVDVVLLTAEDLQDALLPAGNLRESLRALRRADVVVIRQEEWKVVATKVREMLGRSVPLWSIERGLHFPAPLGVLSAGLRPIAFCAIARPQGFAEMLHDAGCGVIETVAFGDHHSYSDAGIEHIIHVANGLRASGFVTTEKDAVKLSAAMRARLETVGPLIVVAMEAEFLNTAEVLCELEERLG